MKMMEATSPTRSILPMGLWTADGRSSTDHSFLLKDRFPSSMPARSSMAKTSVTHRKEWRTP